MTWLYSSRQLAEPRARLHPGGDGRPPFAVVELDEGGRDYISAATSAEAYAMRDAWQRAGDLLAEAEGTAP